MMLNVLAMASVKMEFANVKTQTRMLGTVRNARFQPVPLAQMVVSAVAMEYVRACFKYALVSLDGLEKTVAL